MMRWVSLVTVLGIALAFAACREEGPMEQAGRQVDETIEQLAHGDEGAFESADRTLDETIEEEEEKE